MRLGTAAPAATAAPNVASSFVSHGPFGGAISALAVDPENGTTAYAATGARVFKTVDGGGHWTKVFERDDPFGNVNALLVVPGQPETVYLGAEFNSSPTVLRSVDGGQSWHGFTGAVGIDQDAYITQLISDPAYPAHALCEHRLLRCGVQEHRPRGLLGTRE